MVIGFSGGVDSTALLLLAAVVAERESSVSGLHAVYVHHHLRAQADEDVIHCRELCTRLGVSFIATDVRPRATAGGLAAEARRLRHEALTGCAMRVGAKFIALAHQSDDVLETLLMRLGRGIAVRGLSTIPWTRRAEPTSEIAIVRPLLAESRAELVRLCTSCEVSWREDASNGLESSPRGFLRASVIPALRERWGRIASHAVDASDAARSGEWALAEIAARDGWCGDEIARTQCRERGPLVAASLLASACRARGIPLSPRTVRAVIDAACDHELRPREFSEGAVTVLLTARALRVTLQG